MLRALKSDSVQIASTAAGLALAAYFVTQWQARKKIDPSIDPLRGGADPNFPGGKPITPHLHDPSPIFPSCEVFDPTANLFFNLGDPKLDASLDACFHGVDRSAIVRYTDKDQNIHLLHKELYLPGDVPGECYFPDRDGNLYTPIKFAAPNQGSRLCFNAADTHSMSAWFFTTGNSFSWNPNVNFASAHSPNSGWNVTFQNGINPGTTDQDEVQVLTPATLTSGSLNFTGEIFVRDPLIPSDVQPNVTALLNRRDRRLFMPSRHAIVYWNPHATDDRYKYVAYPMLSQ